MAYHPMKSAPGTFLILKYDFILIWYQAELSLIMT